MKKIIMMLSICSCCFLFTNCSLEDTVPSNNDISTETIIENKFQEMKNNLPAIEPIVEDYWPNYISRKNEDTTAENLSFAIQISSPMVLEIICVTESGKLDMEMIKDNGEKIFSEKNIQTEKFKVQITSSGTYQVIIQAKDHTGSFWIEAQK